MQKRKITPGCKIGLMYIQPPNKQVRVKAPKANA